MKRVIDVLVASLGLVLLALPLVVLIWLVKRRLGRPVFFTQLRPGLHGAPFQMVKFRTMTDERDANGFLLPDSQRMTPFGNWLRTTSLDEIPELWNVVKGDMSLVGPRPLLMEYLPLYNTEQARRHDVRPGITGWAQINGRNALDWEEKFRLDTWYVDNRSNWLDFKVIMLTFNKVIKREGISAHGEATMAKFEGLTKKGKSS